MSGGTEAGTGSSGAPGAGGDSTSGGAAGAGGDDSGTASDVAGVDGGVVGDAAGNVVLTIPPGALLGETYFTFTPVSSIPGLSADYTIVGDTAYHITWSGGGFAEGASVTVRIHGQTVAMLASGSVERLDVSDEPSAGLTLCDGALILYDWMPEGDDYEYSARADCVGNEITVGVVAGDWSLTPPRIVNAPAALQVRAGDRAEFSVSVTGITPINYQWRRNGVDIFNARGPNFALDPVFIGDDGARFSVTARNIVGNVRSADALLTVLPPVAPVWNGSTEFAPFGADIDLPQVGSMAGGGGDFAVWKNGDVLEGRSFAFAPINALAEPARSRPLVVSGRDNLSAYIVFVDDDGTSNCTVGGNRLSVVGMVNRFDAEGQPIPLFRDTLYQSSDCIRSFAAGYATFDPDPDDYAPLVFALMEQSSQAIKVGAGGPYFQHTDLHGGTLIDAWVTTQSVVNVLPTSTACADYPELTADSMRGVNEPGTAVPRPRTSAVLAWVAHNHAICASTLEQGVWSNGAVLFGAALDAEPAEVTTAIGSDGRALVVASKVQDPAAQGYTYRMTAAFRGPSGGNWQVTALDTSAGLALPSAAFSPLGDAWVVWRPNLASAPTQVFAARRPANGTWEPTARISSADATDTRYPRICSGSGGRMLALYSESAAGEEFQVWGRVWAGGAWTPPSKVQAGTDEGRFADCIRYGNDDFARDPFVVWRETDPTTVSPDPPRYRIVAAQ